MKKRKRSIIGRLLRDFTDWGWPDSGSSFDASGNGDRWPWSSQIWSPVSQQLAAGGPISNRASWLSENSPTAASLVQNWVDGLVSTGPVVKSAHPDEATRELLDERWCEFCKCPDQEGTGTLTGFLSKAVRNLVITGESFVHLPIVDRRLKLRLLQTEQVWRAYTIVGPDGSRIFSGVEVDASGKRTAYWVIEHQLDLPWATQPLPVRISVDDLLHLFVPKSPGAVRGLSWLTPVATRLLELDRFEDAWLARMNVAALFTGFIRDIDNTSGIQSETQLTPDGLKSQLSMEPGSLRILPPGTDIVFPQNLPDVAGSEAILKHFLRSIAAGSGLPSALLTGDMSDSSYASARMGLQPFQRSVARLQAAHLVAQLLQPVWERWLTVEILSGRLAAEDFEDNPADVSWRWPAWQSLDPDKDASGDIALLNANLKSRAELIAARGRDIADVDREIMADDLPRSTVAPAGSVEPTEDKDTADDDAGDDNTGANGGAKEKDKADA